MKIGITFDELLMKNIGKEIYLEYIEQNDIKNIELCLHQQILNKDIQREVSLLSNRLKINNSFHIPHHINEFTYDISNFKSERSLITDHYMNFIYDMEEHLNYNPASTQKIVIHGGSFTDNINNTTENSKRFIDWFINKSISRGLDIRLLIETLSPEENYLGNNFEDLIKIKYFFKTKHLDICGDIGHLMRNNDFKNYDELKKLYHCHIHGYNIKSNINHIPFFKSDIDPKKIMESLNKDAVLIHEVLYIFAKYNYLDDLGNKDNFGVYIDI